MGEVYVNVVFMIDLRFVGYVIGFMVVMLGFIMLVFMVMDIIDG